MKNKGYKTNEVGSIKIEVMIVKAVLVSLASAIALVVIKHIIYEAEWDSMISIAISMMLIVTSILILIGTFILIRLDRDNF